MTNTGSLVSTERLRSWCLIESTSSSFQPPWIQDTLRSEYIRSRRISSSKASDIVHGRRHSKFWFALTLVSGLPNQGLPNLSNKLVLSVGERLGVSSSAAPLFHQTPLRWMRPPCMGLFLAPSLARNKKEMLRSLYAFPLLISFLASS